MKEKSIKRLFFALTFMSLFLPVLCFAGTAYYVDPKAPGGGTGTYEKPWNSIAQINAKKFQTGDDVYFKVGTSVNFTERLFVDWNGTANDPVIIGAYYDKNKFGLNGQARPVFDGQKRYPTNSYQFVIQHTGAGNVIVENLHIKNSYGGGIGLGTTRGPGGVPAPGNIIRGNIVEQSGRQAICLYGCYQGLVENNYVDTASLTPEMLAAGVVRHGGAGIEITGFINEAGGSNIVRGNVVRGCGESIGLYHSETNSIAENNVVFDTSQVAIYGCNSRNNIIRNNLVYNVDPYKSLNWRQPERGRSNGIWLDCENNYEGSPPYTGGYKIYGNYIAGFVNGIWVQNNSNSRGVYQKDNEIFDNIVVDCDRNFFIHQSVPQWDNNKIYNNYSYIFTPGLVHVAGYNAYGFTWGKNFFNNSVGNSIPPAGSNAFNAINTVDPGLIKVSGWRDLPVDGSVTAAAFAFTSAEKSGYSVESVSELKIR